MMETLRGAEEPGERANSNEASYKLDLYSIPVFLLEAIILVGLGYSAYHLHFERQQEPSITGFYCDDIDYRHRFVESDVTSKLTHKQTELTIIALFLTIPIVLIIFCELVNSMFGALSFRKIRALCACCKLHSITRRTLRFSAAYLLGFLIVMISCEYLANSTGRLRPYFAQDCPQAYSQCGVSAAFPRSISAAPQTISGSSGSGINLHSFNQSNPTTSNLAPSSSSLIHSSGAQEAAKINSKISSPIVPSSSPLPTSGRIMKRQASLGMAGNILAPAQGPSAGQRFVLERQWIDLTGQNLAQLCNLIDTNLPVPSLSSSSSESFEMPGLSDNTNTNNNNNNNNNLMIEPRNVRAHQLARSWPSFPAAIVTYAILFTSCYLCFVGTARPFRLITCVIVTILLVINMVFNVGLVKEHYNHWDDVAASAFLAFVVVIFVLYVYLNKFRDTHYYEDQKLIKSRRITIHENFKGYNNDGAIGEFNHLDKFDGTNEIRSGSNTNLQGAEINNGSISNNDLAMRYFQIPRANYRGAPRPLSSINQVL